MADVVEIANFSFFVDGFEAVIAVVIVDVVPVVPVSVVIFEFEGVAVVDNFVAAVDRGFIWLKNSMMPKSGIRSLSSEGILWTGIVSNVVISFIGPGNKAVSLIFPLEVSGCML